MLRACCARTARVRALRSSVLTVCWCRMRKSISRSAAAVAIGNDNATPAQDILIDGLSSHNAGLSNSGGAGHGVDILSGVPNYRTTVYGAAPVRRITLRNLDIEYPRANGINISATAATPVSQLVVSGRIVCSSLDTQGRGVSSGTGYLHSASFDVVVRDCPREGVALTGAPGTHYRHLAATSRLQQRPKRTVGRRVDPWRSRTQHRRWRGHRYAVSQDPDLRSSARASIWLRLHRRQ